MQRLHSHQNDDQILNIIQHKQNYEKFLNNVYESIKEKQFFLKKSNFKAMISDDGPKSLPKLITKDFLVTELYSIQRQKAMKQSSSSIKNNIQPAKSRSFNQKPPFKSLEEQQKQISKQNMMLLGLNIQKISYTRKNKRSSPECSNQVAFEEETARNSILKLSVINEDNLFDESTSKQLKCIFTRVDRKERIKSSARTSTMKVRERSATSTIEKKKKLINAQCLNPIYEARINSYRQLIFKMNFTYGVYLNMQKYDSEQGMTNLRQQQKYKAWIGLGNNGNLVRSLIQRRFWWHIVDQKSFNINFIWTQLKNPDYFKKQQTAQIWFLNQTKNRESSSESKERQSTVKRRKMKLKKQQKIREDDFLNKIMNPKEIENYKKFSKSIQNKTYEQKSTTLHLKQITTQNQRVHNHLTNNFYLGNKKALFYNLKEYYQLIGGNLFQAIPLTFHIKKGTKDPQYKRFVAYHKKRQSFIKKQQRQAENGIEIAQKMRNIWIVKPGELTNRGNGITVIDEVYQLDGIMKSENKHQNGIQKTFIVQLYIDRPFLYKKRKFDIRHYMMITQIHGVFKAYWYNEGYIRTASYEFDVHNFEREIHLTNDAVQKYTPLYGKFEPANKLSYNDFQKYLDTTYPKKSYNFETQILPRMKEICLDAVKSSFIKISPERLKHNFQVFGMDFMIDCDFKPWLIEINTNPCLELACPVLSRIIPQMLDQALRLSLDIVYPPPCHYPNTAKHLVPEASLENLKFQLIFDEKIDGQQMRTLYKKSKHNLLQQIGQISDDQVYEDEGKDVPLQELVL